MGYIIPTNVYNVRRATSAIMTDNRFTPQELEEMARAAERYEAERRRMYDDLPSQLIEDPSNPDKLIKHDKRNGKIEVEPLDRCLETEISRLADRRLLDKNERFMIDEIFPTGQIHILSGPSGVGKTRWLLPFIKEWYEGKDLLGYKSNPEPYLYISCDRSAKSLNQTLRKLGLQNWDLHFKTIADIQKDLDVTDYEKLKLEDIIKYYKNIKVFFIEAIGWFQQMGNKVNQYAENLRYWVDVQNLVEKYDVTIIGTTHCPKSKPNDRHDNPRERVMGSVAMGAIVDSILLLEFDDAKDIINKNRVLRIMPRNVEASLIFYSMGPGGILVEMSPEEARELKVKERAVSKLGAKHSGMDVFLETKTITDIIQMADMLEYGESHEISRPTVFRWKDAKLESKELVQIGKGFYRKGQPS